MTKQTNPMLNRYNVVITWTEVSMDTPEMECTATFKVLATSRHEAREMLRDNPRCCNRLNFNIERVEEYHMGVFALPSFADEQGKYCDGVSTAIRHNGIDMILTAVSQEALGRILQTYSFDWTDKLFKKTRTRSID